MTRNAVVSSLSLTMFFLVACAFFAQPPQASPVVPAGEPQIRDIGPNAETVFNCGPGGGLVVKHPSRTMISSHAVEWQVAGQVGVGTHIGNGVIPGGVNLQGALEGRYVAGVSQSIQKRIDWDLPAEPNTIVEYTLTWREVWQPGYIDVQAGGKNFRANVLYRTDIQSDIVGKRVQECGEEQAPVPVPPSSDVQQPSGNDAPTSDYFSADQPLIINNQQFSLPPTTSPPSGDDRTAICRKGAYVATGGSELEYSLTAPDGWMVIIDSWKAYLPPDSPCYENDGMLKVYGPWQGNVRVNRGALCGVPIEWRDRALYDRRAATGFDGRPEYEINSTSVSCD